MLLVTDNGQLTALTKDLTQLWTATLPGSPGAFLHANASDFDQNPGNGEELLVVHENTVTLVASTGATVTTWTPPTPLRLATTANATYGAAPELAVAHTNHALTVLTLDSPPAQFSATNTFAATNLNAPGTTKRALDTPDPAQATCLMVDPPVTVTPIDLDHKLCTNPLNNDPPGNTLQRTQLALTRDPTSNHNPVLAVASHANDLLFLEAFDLTTGLHKWGPLESNNPADQQASALAWTPSRDVTQQPATPYLAVGTQGGRLFLLNYADGTSAWTNPVTAKAGQGPITVHLQIPRATLPGTHVIKSTLQWDQAIAAGKLTQKAHLLTYIEVAEANREFVAGNYWIAMDLRAWMMDWDH